MRSRASPCVFCEIVAGRAPASFVRREADVVAFLDLHPVNPGHTLVVPARHVERVADLSPDEWNRATASAREIGAALRHSGVRCDDVMWLVADGAAAGQDVPHVHAHLIPRWKGDGFGFRFAAGYGAPAERGALDATAAQIRAAAGARTTP